MLLVLGGRGDPVDRALDKAAGQERDRVAGVHGERRVLRLDPLPLAGLVVLYLERRYRLAEEERPRAKI